MVTRYTHVLYQISRVSCFWVREKSVATNYWAKMGADCHRGGAITAHAIILIVIIIIRVDSDGNKVCAYAI